MTESKKLIKSDITKLGFRSLFLQASFNYERMQACGWLVSQLPTLKKIYGDDKKALAEVMEENLEFLNTHPNFCGFLMGILISLEESGEERSVIQGLKIALFGPIAGIGDALFWFTLLPIMAGVCGSLAIGGSVLGPILFVGVYFFIFLLRIPLTHLGYNLGTKSVKKIKESSRTLSKAAIIMGTTVIGGLIASYVSINVLTEIKINATTTVSVQKDFLDKIIPNLLPFAYTFLMYYLVKVKKVHAVVLIAITFIGAIVASFLGIL